MKKTGASSGTGDGASRWSTRQASLFYKRHNNKSFSCRKIPSLFSEVKVITDADLIKESRESSENIVDKMDTSTKRPSASGDQKSKQGQVMKAKENSRRKTNLSSQMNVKHSKFETNLKRKSSNQDSCSRPSKRKPDSLKVVSKGVQKQAETKKTKADSKSPQKTEVKNEGVRSLGSKDLTATGVSSTQYKVLMTRPCSVPVVPVDVMSSAGQQQHGALLLFKKVDPSTVTMMNRETPSKSLESLASLIDRNVHKNIDDKDQNQPKQSNVEMNPATRMPENSSENETKSEGNVSEEEATAPKTLQDHYESGSHTQEQDKERQNNNTILQNEEVQESLDGFVEERNEKDSVASVKQHDVETRESKPDSVPIKRSARISERRANIMYSQPKSEKLGQKKSLAEPNVLKAVGSDYSQENTFIKTSSSDISNQPMEREITGSITTHQKPLKQKTATSSTKYTQRMTWKLQPQMTPVDKINPVSVGDIVWGKVHGHPWWPGRVLAISGIRNEESNNPWDRDAHVSWFGSNTSSIMRIHSLQLFLPNFAKRHKRHKKGFYRVAVRQAQEALQAMDSTD